MTVPAPRVIPDEHVGIGNRMKDCRDVLMLILQRTPPGSRMHREATQAIQALDRLRTRLDCHLHMTVAADRDPRHLLKSVYSGTGRLGWREYDPDEMDYDDFAAWEIEG